MLAAQPADRLGGLAPLSPFIQASWKHVPADGRAWYSASGGRPLPAAYRGVLATTARNAGMRDGGLEAIVR